MFNWLLVAVVVVGTLGAAPPSHPNVLIFVVDDLRAGLGFYGDNISTPNLDAFQRQSLTFDRAYTQQSVCSPSRNSFMSGRRPDKTLVWNFKRDFRQVGPNWNSMPQFFKNAGYRSAGGGKLYHPGHPPNDDPPSWSEPYFQPHKAFRCHGALTEWCVVPEEDTNKTNDRMIVLNGIEQIKAAKKAGTPFFIGVGVHKPHLPWQVPEQYMNLYPDSEEIPLATHLHVPTGMPPIAWTKGAEMGNLKMWTYNHTVDKKDQHDFRKAYYAATTFMDSNVGLILKTLEEENLVDNTIVAFWSDHGYQLGEHNEWMKCTLFEMSARVAMMIRVPWATKSHGERTTAFAELVDMYPTLVELAGMNPNKEPGLDGQSLAAVFEDPHGTHNKTAAYTQFPHCGTDHYAMGNCIGNNRSKFSYMGYSVRTDRWRYTEWPKWDGTKLLPLWDQLGGKELYDHQGDDGSHATHTFDAFENVNVVDDPANSDIVKTLSKQLRAFFPTSPPPNPPPPTEE